MKTAVKRIQSFLLIITLVLSGMCFEHVEADSFFVYTVCENNFASEVLTSAKSVPERQTICTNEIAGTIRMVCGQATIRRGNNKSADRTEILLSFREILPKTPVLTKAVVMDGNDEVPDGRKLIIAYIHNKDGQKGITI